MIIVQAKAIPKDETSKNKIIEAAANLIEKSKLENGNINYNLYSNVQEDTLLFVEQWENLDHIESSPSNRAFQSVWSRYRWSFKRRFRY